MYRRYPAPVSGPGELGNVVWYGMVEVCEGAPVTELSDRTELNRAAILHFWSRPTSQIKFLYMVECRRIIEIRIRIFCGWEITEMLPRVIHIPHPHQRPQEQSTWKEGERRALSWGDRA